MPERASCVLGQCTKSTHGYEDETHSMHNVVTSSVKNLDIIQPLGDDCEVIFRPSPGGPLA